MQAKVQINTGILRCCRIGAPVLIACAVCCSGCGSGSSSAEPLFAQRTGVEVGGKLDIPGGQEFSGLRDTFNSDAQVVVICFLSTECAATSTVAGRVKSLQRKSKAVKFIGYVTSEEQNLAQFLDKFSFAFEIVGDFDHEIADLLGANRTPAFFVFDSQRMLVYQGPLDDSTLAAKDVRNKFLSSAISAAATGKTAPDSRPFVGRPILGEH